MHSKYGRLNEYLKMQGAIQIGDALRLTFDHLEDAGVIVVRPRSSKGLR
jgi:hypothetical protein